jgi:hypothetical protein
MLSLASGAGGRPAGAAAPAAIAHSLQTPDARHSRPACRPGHCLFPSAGPARIRYRPSLSPAISPRRLAAESPAVISGIDHRADTQESDLTRPGQPAQIYVHAMGDGSASLASQSASGAAAPAAPGLPPRQRRDVADRAAPSAAFSARRLALARRPPPTPDRRPGHCPFRA